MEKMIMTEIQDFEFLRKNNGFYVDKTDFIRKWWKGLDVMTMITRPRRFGKTLNMSTLNCFFSNKFENRADLFEGLKIWEDADMREQQGKWPVIYLSYAGIKAATYESAMRQIKCKLVQLFSGFPELYRYEGFGEYEKKKLNCVCQDMSDMDAVLALSDLSYLLKEIYGKDVLIFLDEYETPIMEACFNGYWDQMSGFIRPMLATTFKANRDLERAILTGVTCAKADLIDLNNLSENMIDSNKYDDSFGFAEEEVFQALEDYGFSEEDKQNVKKWYDGYTVGSKKNVYNPFSITHFLKEGKTGVYWADTGSNELAGKLLQTAGAHTKMLFEKLMQGESIEMSAYDWIDYRIIGYRNIWNLLMASGYLKIVHITPYGTGDNFFQDKTYTMELANLEVREMFIEMIKHWFAPAVPGESRPWSSDHGFFSLKRLIYLA